MLHFSARTWPALIGVVALGLLGGGCGGSAHSRAHAPVSASAPYPTSSATPSPRPLTSGAVGGESALAAPGETVGVVTADGAVVALGSGALYSVGRRDQATAAAWSAGQRVAVAPGGDGLTNLARHVTVRVTAAGDAYLADPYSDSRAHRQRTVSNNGAIIVLSDGSIWFVADRADRVTASRWTNGAAILALTDPRRTDELVNTGAPSAVQASYVGYE